MPNSCQVDNRQCRYYLTQECRCQLFQIKGESLPIADGRPLRMRVCQSFVADFNVLLCEARSPSDAELVQAVVEDPTRRSLGDERDERCSLVSRAFFIAMHDAINLCRRFGEDPDEILTIEGD